MYQRVKPLRAVNTWGPLLYNACSWKNLNTGTEVYRFSDKQLAYFRHHENPRYYPRCLCPAGVSLEFFSDSPVLELDYEIISMQREWCHFDLWVDGAWVESVGERRASPGKKIAGFVTGAIEGKPRRMSLYFPHTVHCLIGEMRLSEHACLDSAQLPIYCINFMGDSIIQGMDALYPSCAFPTQVSRVLGCDYLNQGLGGHVFDKNLLDKSPLSGDLFVIAYGTNDWNSGESLAHIRKNCREFIEGLIALFPSAPMLVITPLWRRDSSRVTACGDLEQWRNEIAAVCSPHPRVHMLDGTTMIPNNDRFFTDGVHPTDEGMLHYALSIARAIRERALLPA